jgi:hypothetical protein
MATPYGPPNCEVVPIPFVEPEDPVIPAKVVTEAVAIIILRISSFPVSAIRAYTPFGEIETPRG